MSGFTTRPDGYYWVCWGEDVWEIAEWRYRSWWRFAHEGEFSDSHFEQIDDAPLSRETAQ